MEKKNEEVCRAGTSEKVHVGADGSLEATALWKRYLIDFALSETQVLILYMCSLKVNVTFTFMFCLENMDMTLSLSRMEI